MVHDDELRVAMHAAGHWSLVWDALGPDARRRRVREELDRFPPARDWLSLRAGMDWWARDELPLRTRRLRRRLGDCERFDPRRFAQLYRVCLGTQGQRLASWAEWEAHAAELEDLERAHLDELLVLALAGVDEDLADAGAEPAPLPCPTLSPPTSPLLRHGPPTSPRADVLEALEVSA